jgi:hypothetical protein
VCIDAGCDVGGDEAMAISSGYNGQVLRLGWIYRPKDLLTYRPIELLTHRPIDLLKRLLPCVLLAVMFSIIGCGEESPTDSGGGTDPKTIETGVFGTTYINVEHGFRVSNLPASGWVIGTRKYKAEDIETVLLMAFTTQDIFTSEEAKLEAEVDKFMAEGIPHAWVEVQGPYTDLPTKPDVAREIMDIMIAVWEWMGIEVISRRPVAGANTTGYEAVLTWPSMVMEEVTIWKRKCAFFAKHDKGYMIMFSAPEDKYTGLLAHIDPMIRGFEFLGL